MAHEKTFPICPYKAKGNSKCSHKDCGKHCIYLKHPERCELYQDWVETREYSFKEEKSKIAPINPPENHIGDSTNDS